MDAQEQFQAILEIYGGETASKTIRLLLNDPHLATLKPCTQFLAEHWRDCFSPAMVRLGCQATGGNPTSIDEIASSVSLMNLSFRIWDDIIDKTSSRTLRKTFVGEFGENIALIYGGVVSARAFTTFNKVQLEQTKRDSICDLIWIYWATMARSEVKDERLRISEYHALDKWSKIEAEAINVQTCLKIGAILGNGSSTDIEQLGSFGRSLGKMLDLLKDAKVSLNLTLELEKKIRSNQLPLLLLMAKEESKEIREELEALRNNANISPEDVGSFVEAVQASKAWSQFLSYYRTASEKCLNTLCGESNAATEALVMIARMQSQVFWEITKIER